MLSDGNSVSDKIGNILKIFGMAILCFVVFLTIYCGFVSVLIYCCSSKRIGRIFASKSEIPENRSEISERRQRERNNQTVRENDSLTVNMSNENNEEISQPPPCYEDALKNTKPKNNERNFEMEPPSYSESLLLNLEAQL